MCSSGPAYGICLCSRLRYTVFKPQGTVEQIWIELISKKLLFISPRVCEVGRRKMQKGLEGVDSSVGYFHRCWQMQ